MAIALLSSLGGCAFEPYPPLPIPAAQPVAYGGYSALPTPPEAQGPPPTFASETEAAHPSAVQPGAEPAAPIRSADRSHARRPGRGAGAGSGASLAR